MRPGQPLATLAPQAYRLALPAAEAGLSAAKVDRDQQRADYRRFEELQRKGFISQADLDRRKAALDAAEARYLQAEANARTSGNQADYAVLRAPHDAMIVGVDAEVGQVVAPGQSVIRLARTGEMEVAIGIPEQQLAMLKSARDVRVRLWAGGESHCRPRARNFTSGRSGDAYFPRTDRVDRSACDRGPGLDGCWPR